MTTYSNPAPLRLTVRGRRYAVAAILSLLLAVLVPAVTDIAGATNESAKAAPIAELITVQPGDTLWAIANQVSPDRDPREVVWEIRQLNNFGNGLIAGEQIRVPIY